MLFPISFENNQRYRSSFRIHSTTKKNSKISDYNWELKPKRISLHIGLHVALDTTTNAILLC